jgi:hypothetical protein
VGKNGLVHQGDQSGREAPILKAIYTALLAYDIMGIDYGESKERFQEAPDIIL